MQTKINYEKNSNLEKLEDVEARVRRWLRATADGDEQKIDAAVQECEYAFAARRSRFFG